MKENEYQKIDHFVKELNGISSGFAHYEGGTVIKVERWSTNVCKRLLKEIKKAGYDCTLDHITITVTLKEKDNLFKK